MDSDSIGRRFMVVLTDFGLGLAGLLLVLFHEWFIITLLFMCYLVVITTLGLFPRPLFGIAIPTWALWSFMYLLISNSFEFHLIIEEWPNFIYDQIKKLKRRSRFLIIKVPKMIYIGMLIFATIQLYCQYWSVKKGYVSKALVTLNFTGDSNELEPMFDWSISIFSAAFFFVVYAVPLGSDWVYYRRKMESTAKFKLAYFQNLIVCILHEIRIIYWTPRSPIFPYLIPTTFFLYRIADSPPFFFWNVMAIGYAFATLFGTKKSFEHEFKHSSPYTVENSILARNILLQYGYFPVILYFNLKSGPLDIFGYQLSITQDFLAYTFVLYLALWQAVRICTNKLQVDPECMDVEAGKIAEPRRGAAVAGELKLIEHEINGDTARPLILDKHGAIPVVVEGPGGPQLKKLVLVD